MKLLTVYYCFRNPKLFPIHLKKFLFRLFTKEKTDYNWEEKNGLYEIATMAYLRGILREGDIFIDVGANIGYYEHLFSPLVGSSGRIFAFEPIPELLETKYILPENVECFTLACGSEKGTKTLYLSGQNNDGSSIYRKFILRSEGKTIKKTIEVSVVRLDEFLKEKKVGKIKLIKIDTELYDFEVLKGLSGYFDSGERPIIVCEVQSFNIWQEVLGQDIQELIDYMRFYGYEAYNIYLPNQRVDLTKEIKIGNIIFKCGSKTKGY